MTLHSLGACGLDSLDRLVVTRDLEDAGRACDLGETVVDSDRPETDGQGLWALSDGGVGHRFDLDRELALTTGSQLDG